MTRLLFVSVFLFVCTLHADTFHGKVVDSSGAAVPGADVAALNRLGVLARTVTDASGSFQITVLETFGAKLLVTASGFETKAVALTEAANITLAIAPQTDSVTVAGSAIDIPLSEQGSSASVITREEIAQRNEAQAIDLMRYLPGVNVTSTGARGTVTSVQIRGGDNDFDLVQIDGIPINWFGSFPPDFSPIPTDFLDHIEVVRGAQSAIYGSYANSGVVNFVTRQPEAKFTLNALAEGGSHDERRFALGGSGTVDGFGIGLYSSEIDDRGPVPNSGYQDRNIFATVMRKFGRQNFVAEGGYNASESGSPGPYGSDPAHLFTGIDRVSRNKFDRSVYGAHYQVDLAPRVREELFANIFWNNSYYISPFGDSFENDYRGQVEERTVIDVSRFYTAAFGYVFSREEVKNTFITDTNALLVPIPRNQQGIYWENRFALGKRLFLNLGARGEVMQTARIPADAQGFPPRPEFAANTVTRVNPKGAIAYILRAGTSLHASGGTGIRPPNGFELAFTDNPRLKPERTTTFDAGIEQRLFKNRVSLNATYFYSRFYDLIVTLGGSLSRLSSYQSDNLSNARAQGGEFSVQIRPARWISLAGNYTLLDSEILSLTGSTDLAQTYFQVGEPLIRRAHNAGSMVAAFSRGRVSANITGYFRGKVLDVEPNFGASAGLFHNPGFANFGVNVNYALPHGMTLYGDLRNALNWHYEEAFGFPSPLLNFAGGVKWTFTPTR